MIATFFYCGYLPLFPGTWGSLVGLFLGYLALKTEYFLNYLYILYFLIIIGIWAASEYDKYYKTKDCKHIVIDEVVGQLISIIPLYFFNTKNILYYFLGFILFRFFDITKVLGIKQIQKFPGGLGVLADDILAGIYSAIILWGVLWKTIG